MARGGHKYPLIVYQHMLNRWWPALMAIGLGMFALAYSEYIDPMAQFVSWRWQLFAGIGVLAILIGIFFLILRHLAYVQPFPEYLKLVTPFMRLNISYKRIRKTTTTEMHYLFPFKGLSGWMQDIFEPLAGKTAMVIDLNGYPISPVMLRFFLSRFFFKDKTPHLVILVKDWMRFSSELESMRTGIDMIPSAPQKRQKSSILSQLPKK
jgi:MFS family permease